VNQPNYILNELQELSPTLAAIPKVNVFTVPEGYFETLPALLLLQTGKPVSTLNNTVPQGYFDNLAGNIMSRIKQDDAAESELLQGIGNKNVFTVPAGYFEALADNILSRINNETAADETRSVSELVAGIGNKNVFNVPAGYFDNLASEVNTKLYTPAKVVSMGPRKTILRYAAAAVVTGFLAMSAFFVYNKNTGTVKADDPVMTAAEAIINNKSFDKEMNSLNDADIVVFWKARDRM